MRAVEFTGVAERDATIPGTALSRMKENWNNTHDDIGAKYHRAPYYRT